jgi:hypothetical protein
MPKKLPMTAAGEPAGNAAATAVQFECEVLQAGAARKYGSSKHKKGRGARVFLDETEKTAAEKLGWVKVIGLKSVPVAAPAADEAPTAN